MNGHSSGGSDEDPFGVFSAAPPGETTIKTVDTDHFGAFEAPSSSDAAAITTTSNGSGLEDNRDFGAFSSPTTAAEVKGEETHNLNGNATDDDFGEFNGSNGKNGTSNEESFQISESVDTPAPSDVADDFGAFNTSANNDPEPSEAIPSDSSPETDFGAFGGSSGQGTAVEQPKEDHGTGREQTDSAMASEEKVGIVSVAEDEDDFGDFGETTAPETSPAPPADDDDFGGFSSSPPKTVAEQNPPMEERATPSDSKEAEEEQRQIGNDDDDLGDFGAAPQEGASEIKNQNADPDDGFGDFGEAKAQRVTEPQLEATTDANRDDDDFGDFGEAPTSAPVGDGTGQATSGNDGDFGDFGNAPSSAPGGDVTIPVTADNENDDFGDFGEAPVSTPAVDETDQADANDDGDSGDFGEAPVSAPAGDQTDQTTADDDDDFGDFGEAPPKIENGNAKEDKDDFGGFGNTKTAPEASTTIDEEDDDFGDFGEANQTPVPDVDDDDDFGDFGEADTSAIPAAPTSQPPPPPMPAPANPLEEKARNVFGQVFAAAEIPSYDPSEVEVDTKEGNRTIDEALKSLSSVEVELNNENQWIRSFQLIQMEVETRDPSNPLSVVKGVPFLPYDHLTFPVAGVFVDDLDSKQKLQSRREGDKKARHQQNDDDEEGVIMELPDEDMDFTDFQETEGRGRVGGASSAKALSETSRKVGSNHEEQPQQPKNGISQLAEQFMRQIPDVAFMTKSGLSLPS